jgi:hypothetical protein
MMAGQCQIRDAPHTMFHFTIRDVLWLTVTVAMASGWYCDRRLQADRHAKEVRIQGELIRSYQTEASRARESEAAGHLQAAAK